MCWYLAGEEHKSVNLIYLAYIVTFCRVSGIAHTTEDNGNDRYFQRARNIVRKMVKFTQTFVGWWIKLLSKVNYFRPLQQTLNDLVVDMFLVSGLEGFHFIHFCWFFFFHRIFNVIWSKSCSIFIMSVISAYEALWDLWGESAGSTEMLSFQQTCTEYLWLKHCVLGCTSDTQINETIVSV